MHNSVLKVSELNRNIRQMLENQYGDVQVEGEISNLSKASSGHWYFTLKDQQAQLRCAFFKFQAQYCRLNVQHGSKVIARGKLSLYEGRGDYQLIVQSLADAGEGQLQQAFLALKNKLAQQGLFDPSRKRPVPEKVFKVALITAQGSAALQDMLSILARRNPMIAVELYPASVQGAQAVPDLLRALAQVQAYSQAQVVILGRGGGSLEDLWAFNNEQLAHAIRACRLPVISAVGHETDFSISDWAADLRAPTPSAAAELVSPLMSDWQERCQALSLRLRREFLRSLEQKQFALAYSQQQLQQQMQWQWQRQQHRLAQTQSRLRHPAEQLAKAQLRLQSLEQRLQQGVQQQLNRQQQGLSLLGKGLSLSGLERRQQQLAQQLKGLQQSLNQSQHNRLQRAGQALAMRAQALAQLSPLATLGRGYAIVYQQQRAISRLSELEQDKPLQLRLQDGECQVRLEQINKVSQSQGLEGKLACHPDKSQ